MSSPAQARMALLAVALLAASDPARASAPVPDTTETTDAAAQRPFVRGGVYDKPFVATLFGGTSVGGYMEFVWHTTRSGGVTEETGFEARRFNIFLHSSMTDRLRLFAELEFEHGTEEIVLEFASIDFEFHPALTLRGGILLSPLGKFNLTHDSPLNPLTDRPLVSTQIIPTALSEAGLGFLGRFEPGGDWRITYELYGVNGFTDGVISSGEGTRIPLGEGAVGEDNNQQPSFVGRAAVSPMPEVEIGISGHTGIYNIYYEDGFTIDDERRLSIGAIDWEYAGDLVEFAGEYATASIDVPPSLEGLYAESQRGIYAQGVVKFGRELFTALPDSKFSGVVRYDAVDFDADLEGDSQTRLSVGMNFHPTADFVIKTDYHHDWFFDRVNVETRSAGVNFSLATYF